MNLADMAMVGRLGAAALAAVGMGSMVVWAVLSTGISLRTAVQTVASRRLGQEKYTQCGTALHNGILLALTTGAVFSLGGYLLSGGLAPRLLVDPLVIDLCRDYMRVAFISVLFSSVSFAFQGFYTGIEKTRIHMNVTITANLVNIYLNAGLIYGRDTTCDFFAGVCGGKLSFLAYAWGWFPFPELGVKGAATATLIASIWMLLHYSIYLLIPKIRSRFGVLSWNFDAKMLRRQLELLAPQAAQMVAVMIGFVLFFKIVGLIGTAQLAATEIVFSIMNASFMPAAGVGQACATLVGKYMGEKRNDRAVVSIIESIRWSLLIMGTMGIIFFVFPHRIVPVFTNDPAVMRAGIVGLRILAAAQFADAVGMTLWYALTGAGNTRFPAIAEIIICWGFFLPVSYLLGVVLNVGFIGAWVAFASYIFVFAAVMTAKMLRGDWKNIMV